jgi:Fe-S oxidoreductase/nitrate reductase gamma subunit
MPERIEFWGIPDTWGSPALYVYSLMFLSAAILLIRLFLRARLWWTVGRPGFHWDHLLQRSGRVIKYALIQTKVFSQRYPGLMHTAIAWSFFVFFLGTGLATIDSHFYKILVGTPYLLHKLVMDIFVVIFFLGATLACFRRSIQKPSRLTFSSGFTISLFLLILIVLGGLATESLRLAVEKPAWAWWSPVGWLVAQLWLSTGVTDISLMNWHLVIWVTHLLIVAFTIITLPVSTLLHIITGPANIFFSDPNRKPGKLFPIPENSKGEPIYADDLQDLSWLRFLNADACTECGRCQDACPAYAAGTNLNPKFLILALRDALHQKPIGRLMEGGTKPLLVGDSIKIDTIWSCTTCLACVQECPVLINHTDAIVDFRRFLVLDGQLDSELQSTLENFGRYGNSFGQSDRMRARWAQTISPKIKDARREEVEYLWFVGDYASFSPAISDITLKTAGIFNKIGLDFGILYESERNSGNDIRRIGEEGLFDMLMEKNKTTLENCRFKTILTTDPHSYNTLKNEYSLDDNINILHYTELLDNLLTTGVLKFNRKLDLKVTYHDPCFLGRYNDIYSSPRRVIRATGCELVEMPRHSDRAFCCGAGGGRIWMAEANIKERPSEIRIREAANLDGVSNFVVACPKDITMFRDAVKTTSNENNILVTDLIELVYDAL